MLLLIRGQVPNLASNPPPVNLKLLSGRLTGDLKTHLHLSTLTNIRLIPL